MTSTGVFGYYQRVIGSTQLEATKIRNQLKQEVQKDLLES